MQLLESMDSCAADSASAAMPRKLASLSTVKIFNMSFYEDLYIWCWTFCETCWLVFRFDEGGISDVATLQHVY
ncbi:hypothetical protein H5410_034046 [Solanum commersonii]|uniref:Uncharacterized protein n=1 Tax=Solanum commersonii TaxID=4109 RepID=A0A9J5YUE0_SOLCO|nr:hypothetical protein H5410_034046 [Solanum commersonii]